MFAVIVIGKEMRSGCPGNPVVGKENEKYWVVDDDYGISSTSLSFSSEVPFRIHRFKTKVAAMSFAANWDGHPWWCSPKDFEVIKIKPKTIIHGWERA